MHAAFGDVLWIVLAFGVIASIWAMKGAAKEWEDYNERGLYMESVRAARNLPVSAAVASAERDSEIRQMVEAANARRVRRGEAPRDVDSEVARLGGSDAAEATAGPGGGPVSPDPELEDEVRALVQLRNQRRIRKGQEPLDVDREIRRELDELSMLRHGAPPPPP